MTRAALLQVRGPGKPDGGALLLDGDDAATRSAPSWRAFSAQAQPVRFPPLPD